MSNFPDKTDLFFIKEFDNFANNYIENELSQDTIDKGDVGKITNKKTTSAKTIPQKLLTESISYTLLAKTKRFRPLLIIYTAKALGLDYKKALPWALAIEMIHSFSLIHDDLPCMDDDDLRRGKPSNHKVFGEALALLSGNSLLVEAFAVLLKYFSSAGSSALCIFLMKEITKATGVKGMMLGQVGDLILDKKIFNKKIDLEPMSKKSCNELKTGALIKAAVLGVIYIYQEQLSQENKKKQAVPESVLKKKLIDFSFYLGRAFQWADDLIDQEGNKDMVEQKLKADSRQALQCLEGLPGDFKYLEHLVMANKTHFQ